jgi:DUF1365 family protein
MSNGQSAGPLQSAIYQGVVVHQRFKPTGHRLRYRIVSLLLDLDELPALSGRFRLLGIDRFGLFSIRQSDFGAGTPTGLRDWVSGQCAAAGIEADGAIRLLAMPRVLGHAFNPLSVFFCYRADGGLAATLYEVRNTFGERHSYLIPAPSGTTMIRQSCRKVFYVSPFMPMDMEYRFRVVPPGRRVSVVIDGLSVDRGKQGRLITASLSGRRAELSDGALLRAFLGAPALGIKVLGGIHWEALKLWRKKVGLYTKPAPPADPITIVTG